MKWFENHFGKGTKTFTGYLDSKDRVFLIPQKEFVLSKDHNCDEMGCGSVGPHIIAVYLSAKNANGTDQRTWTLEEYTKRYNDLATILQSAQRGLKVLTTENKRLKESLQKYGQHLHICHKRALAPSIIECTCGLEQALKGE